LVKSALKRFGGVDILINNAGIGYSGRVVDSNPEDAEQIFLYQMTFPSKHLR